MTEQQTQDQNAGEAQSEEKVERTLHDEIADLERHYPKLGAMLRILEKFAR